MSFSHHLIGAALRNRDSSVLSKSWNAPVIVAIATGVVTVALAVPGTIAAVIAIQSHRRSRALNPTDVETSLRSLEPTPMSHSSEHHSVSQTTGPVNTNDERTSEAANSPSSARNIQAPYHEAFGSPNTDRKEFEASQGVDNIAELDGTDALAPKEIPVSRREA